MFRIALLILSLDKTLSKVSFGIFLSIAVSGCGFQLSSYDLSSLPTGLSVRVESNALGKEFRDVLEREIKTSGARVSEIKSDVVIEISDLFCSDEMERGIGGRSSRCSPAILSID